MSILIKNGRVVTASESYIADIYTKGEKIVAVGKDLDYKADRVIDATDKLVFPGGIDPHVHLDMPFMGTYSSDDYETGTRAALHGGTTTVIDFILQTQGDTLHNALKIWQKKSEGKAVGDYSYHMAVTDFNDDVAKEVVGGVMHIIEFDQCCAVFHPVAVVEVHDAIIGSECWEMEMAADDTVVPFVLDHVNRCELVGINGLFGFGYIFFDPFSQRPVRESQQVPHLVRSFIAPH